MAALTSAASICGQRVQAAFRPAQAQQQRGALQVRASQSLQGTVVSTAQNKTAVVEVATLRVHPVYQKRVRVTTKYQAHDEQQSAQVGDIVTLAPCRPLSKSKRFAVETIVKKAQ